MSLCFFMFVPDIYSAVAYANANASKCHFLLSPYQLVTIKIKDSTIISTKSKKLLGVTIESDL